MRMSKLNFTDCFYSFTTQIAISTKKQTSSLMLSLPFPFSHSVGKSLCISADIPLKWFSVARFLSLIIYKTTAELN